MFDAAMTTTNQAIHSSLIAGADREARRVHAEQSIRTWLGDSSINVTTSAQVSWLQAEAGTIPRQAIESVLHELSMHAFSDMRRAIVIDPADALTPEAANMLLKSLEEPPAGVRFYLLVSTVARVLPTLRSRSSIEVPHYVSASGDVAEARKFVAEAIPGRLSIIAGLTEREDQKEFLANLLDYARQIHWFAAAEWLQAVIAAQGHSLNLRLALETFAVRYEQVSA